MKPMPPTAASSASSPLLLLALRPASAASLGCKALKVEGPCWAALRTAVCCSTRKVEASGLLQWQQRQ
jgi:hypothetical protein